MSLYNSVIAETLLNLISDEEYSILGYYRDSYADGKINYAIPIRELLKLKWAENKGNLYKLLGNNLQITKDFEYNKDQDELYDQMRNMLHGYETFGREKRNGNVFYQAYMNWVDSLRIPDPYRNHYGFIKWSEKNNNPAYQVYVQREQLIEHLYYLINITSLVKNIYEGSSFELPIPNDKLLIIQKGSKTLKMLGKIAHYFNLPGFEDFRIAHSCVQNDKIIKGKITLSIHPLDYWTMSDNDCGWESCMNWYENGCYRRGTIEMMNSPMVVIAYIASEDDMNISANYTWNNKKWRELFIVNKDLISAIKQYPYYNAQLEEYVVKWIKDLAEKNMRWKYYTDENNKPYSYHSNTKFLTPNSKTLFKINFFTDSMYCDMGSQDNGHYLYYSINMEEALNGKAIYDCNYSGESQCVICGQTTVYFETESCLSCRDCDCNEHCEVCGCTIYEGDTYCVEGQYICESCYENETEWCQECEERHFTDNLTTFRFIAKPETSQKLIELYDKYNQKCQDNNYWAMPTTWSADNIQQRKECGYETVAEFYTSLSFCGNCVDEFVDKYLINGWDSVKTCAYYNCGNAPYYFIPIEKIKNIQIFYDAYDIPYCIVKGYNYPKELAKDNDPNIDSWRNEIHLVSLKNI